MKSSIQNPNQLTARDVQIMLAIILLGAALLGGLTAFNAWLAGLSGTGDEFLTVWNGVRAYFLERLEPYPGVGPRALDLPFPLLILFYPFAWIPDPLWARAIWMTLTEAGLVLLVLLALRLADWRPSGWFRFLLLLFSLTWVHSAAAVLNGSFSVLLVLMLVGALFALRAGNDEAAGFLLAISAMKWETTILLWALLLIGSYSAKRWRVFAGLGMVWTALGAAGFLLYSGWVWPYLRAVVANWRAGGRLTPAMFLEQWLPGYGAQAAQVIVGVSLIILLLEWFAAARSNNFQRLVWAAALSLAVTPLLGLASSPSSLAILVFPFTFLLPFAWQRWEKRPYLLVSLLLAGFYFVPLLLKIPALSERLPVDALQFLLPPLLAILGLYWVRWYVVRPPRTWLDEVKRELGR